MKSAKILVDTLFKPTPLQTKIFNGNFLQPVHKFFQSKKYKASHFFDPICKGGYDYYDDATKKVACVFVDDDSLRPTTAVTASAPYLEEIIKIIGEDNLIKDENLTCK